jgi:uncharacterized membrane protein YjgN (DUF898 family)
MQGAVASPEAIVGVPLGGAVLPRMKCELGFGAIIGHVILWFLLIIVTLGIAAFFFPYSMNKYALNNTYVVDGAGTKLARLRCNVDVFGSLGHVIVWMIISILTLGIGFIFYIYRVNAYCLGRTSLARDIA